jgi:hypothetical protein
MQRLVVCLSCDLIVLHTLITMSGVYKYTLTPLRLGEDSKLPLRNDPAEDAKLLIYWNLVSGFRHPLV